MLHTKEFATSLQRWTAPKPQTQPAVAAPRHKQLRSVVVRAASAGAGDACHGSAVASRREALAAVAALAAAAGGAGLGLGLRTPPTAAKAVLVAEQVIRDLFAAYSQGMSSGDFSGVLALCDSKVKWESNMNGGFKGKGYAGVERYFKYLYKVQDPAGAVPIKFAFDEDKDEVLVLTQINGVGKLTGREYNTTVSQFFIVDLDSRKVKYYRELVDTGALGPAFGDTPY